MRYFKWVILSLLVVVAIINLPIDDQSRFASYQDKIKGYQETLISAGKELFSSLPLDQVIPNKEPASQRFSDVSGDIFLIQGRVVAIADGDTLTI